jgi:hypothetical protein
MKQITLSKLISVSSSSSLGGTLGSTKDLLLSVLLLLSLLSGSLFNLLGQSVSDQSVSWLKLLGVSSGLVDQTETSGLTSTELGSETENGNGILVGLVGLSQSFTQLVLGDVWSVWVQDVNDELSS